MTPAPPPGYPVGPDLLAAGVRAAWTGLAAGGAVLAVWGAPAGVAAVRTPCDGGHPACLDAQLPAEAVGWLADLGIPLGAYAVGIGGAQLAVALGLLALAGALAWRRPRDPAALLFGLAYAALAVTLAGGPDALARVHPGLDPVLRLCWFVQAAALLPSFCVFPDGRFVPGWTRWAAAASVAFHAVEQAAPALFAPGAPGRPLPALVRIAEFALILGVQVHRYRRVSSPVQQRQALWLLAGVGLLATVQVGLGAVAVAVPAATQPGSPAGGLLRLPAVLAITVCVGATAVAILWHRAVDLGVVLSRTLVYGGLSVAAAAAYGLAVGVLGGLLGAGGRAGGVVLATAAVTVAALPLRARLQRAVDRALYGQRGDPYEVVSGLTARLARSPAPEDVPRTVVDTVVTALRLPYAAVVLERERGSAPVVAAERGEPTGVPVELPVTHHEHRVGTLLVSPRAGERALAPADRRLLDDLAAQAGVALHAVALTQALQRERERLVAAREDERRRLRRDLHDGLGPALAGQALGLETARLLLDRDPAAAARLLERLSGAAGDTVDEVRRVTHGLRPPALDELGLAGALEAEAERHRSAGLAVTVEAPAPAALADVPAAVEVAAYRIVAEALSNVGRHAGARTCTVRLWRGPGWLELEVRDDGRGLAADRSAGVGTVSMRERAEELGGWCTLTSEPGTGTRVRARLPW